MSNGVIYQLKIGNIKYIGQTNNFERRKQQHLSQITQEQKFKWNIVRQYKSGGSISPSYAKTIYMMYKFNLTLKDLTFEELEVSEYDVNELVKKYPELAKYFKLKYKNSETIKDNLKKVERETREQYYIIKNKTFLLGINGVNNYIHILNNHIKGVCSNMENRKPSEIKEALLQDPHLDFKLNLWKNQSKAIVNTLKQIDENKISWEDVIPHCLMSLESTYSLSDEDFNYLTKSIKEKEMKYIEFFEVNIKEAKRYKNPGSRTLLPTITNHKNKESFVSHLLKILIK